MLILVKSFEGKNRTGDPGLSHQCSTTSCSLAHLDGLALRFPRLWVGGAIYLVFTGPDPGSPKLGFASESPLRGVLLICRDPAGSCCGQGQHEQSWECCLSRGKFPCCSLGLAQCPYVSCVHMH